MLTVTEYYAIAARIEAELKYQRSLVACDATLCQRLSEAHKAMRQAATRAERFQAESAACSCNGWCDCHKPGWPESETCDCTGSPIPPDQRQPISAAEYGMSRVADDAPKDWQR